MKIKDVLHRDDKFAVYLHPVKIHIPGEVTPYDNYLDGNGESWTNERPDYETTLRGYLTNIEFKRVFDMRTDRHTKRSAKTTITQFIEPPKGFDVSVTGARLFDTASAAQEKIDTLIDRFERKFIEDENGKRTKSGRPRFEIKPISIRYHASHDD